MAPLRPPIAPVQRKIPRRKRSPVPEPIRQQVTQFAKRLRKNSSSAFAGNPGLKHSVASLLRSKLPPLSRGPGRPGHPDVTRALKLYDKRRRAFPGEPNRERWANIYPAAIEGHSLLNPVERRDAEQQLRERVRWRLRWRRRRKRGAIFAKESLRAMVIQS
jgi:hypothetical protein